jgi:chitin disaccharide deacetylase
MKKNVSFLLIFVFFFMDISIANAQAQKSLAERLGYPAGARLLIIHADDLAVAHSENRASFKAMGEGMVNSASIMVPCPWLVEVAEYAKAHPGHDLGLHLTVTSEWKHYKWGPVASRADVAGLTDGHGYFYDNCAAFAANARPDEVEIELRAQIERAKAMGIEPTHFDSHMGCLFFSTPEIFEIYLKLGREYGVPTLVSRDMMGLLPESFRQAITDEDIVIDRIFSASPEDYKTGMAAYYEKVIRSMEPGVSELIIHTAFDDEEMQGVTVDHPDWGAAWRQADFNFFAGDACRKIIEEEGIKLITWREIGKLLK